MRKIFKTIASYAVIALIGTSCQQEKLELTPESSFVLMMPDEEQFTKLSVALRAAAQLGAIQDANGRTSNVYYPPSTQPITPENYEAGFVQSGVNQFGEGFRQDWANFKALPAIQDMTNKFDISTGTALVSKIINTSTVSSPVKSQLRSFASQYKTLYDNLVMAEYYNPSITEATAEKAFHDETYKFETQVNNNTALSLAEKNALLSDIRHLRDNMSTYARTVAQVNDQQIAAGGRVQKTRFGKFLVKLGNFVTTVVVITGLAVLVAVTAPTGSTAAYIDIFKTAGYAAILGIRGLFRPWNQQFWWT